MDMPFTVEEARRADPDRFLISLFYPVRLRPALWGLWLLNAELSRTRDVVNSTQLGQIRLQWWRDEIGKLYAGGACGQIPMLSTIAPYIHQQVFPQGLFEDLLLAREFDLEDVAPGTLDGVRHYADFTTTPLTKLAMILAGEEAEEAQIRRISTNFGLIGLIRSVPYMLSKGRCLLPEDRLRARSLTPQKIMDFNHKKEILEVVKEIAAEILPPEKTPSRFLALSQKTVSIYLKHLKKNSFDVFSGPFQAPPPFMAARLAWPL